MNKNLGIIEYKCRRCGRIDNHIGVPDLNLFLQDAIIDVDIVQKVYKDISGIKMHILHFCNDGNIGVADLIGGEHEKVL